MTIELAQLVTAHVPCNGCYECCRDQTVAACKAFGDDIPAIENHADRVTKDELVAYFLHKKPNGDCWFLDRKSGCTIYDKRPLLCRVYDCVAQLEGIGGAATELPEPIRKAARWLAAAGHVPDNASRIIGDLSARLTPSASRPPTVSQASGKS